MGLDLWRLQTQPLTNDEHDAATDARPIGAILVYDVPDLLVSGAFNPLRLLSVDHHRAGIDDEVGLLWGRLVLQIHAIEAELLLHTLDFRHRRIVTSYAKLAPQDVTNQNAERLSGPSRCPDWSAEIYREKLRSICVVENPHITDSVQWCD